jgi:hypothetical protein
MNLIIRILTIVKKLYVQSRASNKSASSQDAVTFSGRGYLSAIVRRLPDKGGSSALQEPWPGRDALAASYTTLRPTT